MWREVGLGLVFAVGTGAVSGIAALNGWQTASYIIVWCGGSLYQYTRLRGYAS